ncbi:MAG: cytochrome c assembly protein [Bacteroidetes bacterium]|nr:cytochrome c assembly protein [Bacteroidota bacterium]
MEELKYIGEALIYKQLGHFFLVFGFVTSLLGAVGYFFATQRRHLSEYQGWRKIGRWGFILHGISVFAIMATITAAMVNHRFEYQYVWQHVSEDLPFQYIFSAFWEGQEGSFLLWMFWHAVLGGILLFRAKKWEAPVLSIISLVQAFIFTMIVGIYFTDEIKMGSNPLLLLRDTMDIPLFANADYVKLIQGNGLNPLLQNYWMTIHPPTLFLGFASTVVPFAFAFAGLWTKEYKAWMKPALPWALFSGAILGTGILMGGAWAYEALSFGGYWAWDPVENMSLVPWILLVAGIHTHLVARSTGYSIKSTLLFYTGTFVMILYSTFLTRSGILGDTSVHAFTELGLETQLTSFMIFFTAAAIFLLILRRKDMPSSKEEEALPSKEFWMFIGSLVLLFSSVIITASTSLPVVNKITKIFDPEFKGYTISDPISHYNKYMLWIGVFIGLLSGAAQFLRYKEFNFASQKTKFAKHIGIASVGAVALTVLSSFWIKLGEWQFWLLMFTGLFTVVANTDYIFSFAKRNLKLAGSAFSHIGFGIMVAGIIASGLNKQHISSNPVAQAGLLDAEMLQKNVLLFKNMPMYMSGYQVTYKKDTLEGNLRIFTVNYEKLDSTGKVVEDFNVYPQAIYDNKVTEVKAYNPSTKRYFGKDIFTHLMMPPSETSDKAAQEQESNLVYRPYEIGGEPISIIDSIETQSGKMVGSETKVSVVGVNYHPTHPDYEPAEGDFAVGVKLGFEKKDTTFFAEPMVYLRGKMWGSLPVQLNDLSMKVRLPEATLVRFLEADKDLNYKKFIFKNGQSITLNGKKITFAGVNKAPDVPTQKGDVAVSAVMKITDPNYGEERTAEPVFIIRNGEIITEKSELPSMGLHFYLTKIDPTSESFELQIAEGKASDKPIPVEIAQKSFRTDYIVLESIVFPGINLFWIGSVLMMGGLALAMFRRRAEKNASSAEQQPIGA